MVIIVRFSDYKTIKILFNKNGILILSKTNSLNAFVTHWSLCFKTSLLKEKIVDIVLK